MTEKTNANAKPPSFRSRRRQRMGDSMVYVSQAMGDLPDDDVDVGRCLRRLRCDRNFSIRHLAELSGLNVNTLSLIENGKTSPSVSTLQQLAGALEIPISAFFEVEVPKTSISFQKAGQSPKMDFPHGILEDLGAGLTMGGGQPFLVTLEPKASSGATPIVHTGHEFVYCLEGRLTYTIEGNSYFLDPGDSLLFEAHLPHCWRNMGEILSRSLMILCPADESENPVKRHFIPE